MKDDSAIARSAKKRRKLDEKPQLQTNGAALDPKHEKFLQWSRDRGVKINSVKPAALPGRGIGLMTTAKIRKGDQILFVPEKAMFRPNATSIGFEVLKSRGSPHAQLALCLAAELSNAQSPLQTWTATWPTRMDFTTSLPRNWPPNLKKYIPESVRLPLDRQNEDWLKDEACYSLLGEPFTARVDLPAFQYCWEIVNSRSFHFKPAGIKPGYMVLCPFIDYTNHGANGTGVLVRQTPKGYEAVADRDYEPGEEMLFTYGAHSNDKLLVHYGFVNSYAPGEPTDDDIRLDHIIIPAMSSATREALQDVGFLGGYALLPASNDICFKTQVAIRSMLLTANEWEYFISCGEDLSGDQSDKVVKWLEPKLKEYHGRAKKMLEDLLQEQKQATEREQEAVKLLRLRWQQIVDALETFQPSLSTGKP